MKPINFKETGCNPISSNCVIWQGPDIECISLCKGDSVSAVIAKLAEELCNLIDTFNLDNFDLTCLGLETAPADFQAFIQVLINRICTIEGIEPPVNGGGSGDCPNDCIVNICEEFYYLNELGDTITTMSLTNYVTAIGNRVCSLIGQITTINATLQDHEDRIITLENAPPPTFVIPKVTPTCVLPATPVDQNILLTSLEQAFCELIGATGGANDIYTAITKQCAGLGTSPQLAGSGSMSSISGWAGTTQNLANAINNIWLTLCDVRAAIQNIQLNCCETSCDGVNINIVADVTGTILTLFYTGVIPSGWTECAAQGTSVTITDENGGSTTQFVPVVANLNGAGGYSIDLSSTPVNEGLNLTITHTLCFTDGSQQCQSLNTLTYLNTALCPTITTLPSETTIPYSFNWINTSGASIVVRLYDTTGVTLIASNSHTVGGPGIVNGTFTGLVGSTNYKIVLIYSLTGSRTENTCPQLSVDTASPLCLPPTNVTTDGIKRDGEPGYVEP